ncbi:MAG: Fic family protein [Corynebacterium sp.]|nr:Fic family protein [Corynebacterium sp.]
MEEKARIQHQRWAAYLYEGTNVLRNKDGITDPETWRAQERAYTSVRAATLPKLDFYQSSAADNLKAIHFHLFQDCYEWAGEFRNVEMGEDNPFHPEGFNFFCDYEKIPGVLADLQRIYDQLIAGAVSLNMDEKTTMLAKIHAALNYAHPFRSGNGRSTQTFMDATARHVGVQLDFSLIQKNMMDNISQKSMRNL